MTSKLSFTPTLAFPSPSCTLLTGLPQPCVAPGGDNPFDHPGRLASFHKVTCARRGPQRPPTCLPDHCGSAPDTSRLPSPCAPPLCLDPWTQVSKRTSRRDQGGGRATHMLSMLVSRCRARGQRRPKVWAQWWRDLDGEQRVQSGPCVNRLPLSVLGLPAAGRLGGDVVEAPAAATWLSAPFILF